MSRDAMKRLVFDGTGLQGQDLGTGLKEILIVPWGLVDTKKGSFLIDDQAADAIVEEFISHGVDVPIDFEHTTVGGEYARPDRMAPAAGWIKQLWSAPGVGLKALVEWTERGRNAIRNGEYGYLSPVLFIRKDDRRAVELHSAAVVTKPAIPRMERLAASSHKTKEIVMAEQEIQREANTDSEGNADIVRLIKRILALLSLEESDNLTDTLQSIHDKVRDLVDEENVSDDAEVAASVRTRLGLSPTAGSAEVTVAMSISGPSAELATMQLNERSRVACALVEGYVGEGKLLESDSGAIEAAMSLATNDPGRLTALMSNAAPIVPQGRLEGPTQRQNVIAKAAREFKLDDGLQKTTGVEAVINMALADAGLATMSDDEAREYRIA